MSRSLEALLTDHQHKVLNKEVVHRLNIRRKYIWEDGLKAFRKGFPFHASLRVVFLGEPAVDVGGPLREFFTLLMQTMMNNNSVFVGPEDCKTVIHSMKNLANRTYFYCGQIMAVSVMQGGPGPSCLSHAVVDYLTYGLAKVSVSKDEITDDVLKDRIKAVSTVIMVSSYFTCA